MSNASKYPLHKLAGKVSLHVWSMLYEEDFCIRDGPDEDALYDRVHYALMLALTKPDIRQELARALKAGRDKNKSPKGN